MKKNYMPMAVMSVVLLLLLVAISYSPEESPVGKALQTMGLKTNYAQPKIDVPVYIEKDSQQIV